MKIRFLWFLLPIFGVSIASYALWSEMRFNTDVSCTSVPSNVLDVYPVCVFHSPYPAIAIAFNEAVNLPAFMFMWFAHPAWIVESPQLLSIRSFVLLFAIACWWCLGGLELDRRLLRQAAGRFLAFHYAWLGLATLFQLLAAYVVIYALMTRAHLQNELLLLGGLCWSQVLAFMFLRSYRKQEH